MFPGRIRGRRLVYRKSRWTGLPICKKCVIITKRVFLPARVGTPDSTGVDGCWCAPRSSKPVRGVKSLSGEFDSHMLPPEPRGRVPRGFLKNVDFPLDRTEGSSYNTTVRGVSRTISYPGVAQLVARMVRDHEAVSSNLATRTNENP